MILLDPTQGNLRRTVFSLSWPAVTRMSLNMLVQVVDLAMVGRLGAAAIAAVGVSNQIFFLTISVISAFGIGAMALVAQAIGAKDVDRAKDVARQALIFTAVSTFTLTLVGFFFAEGLLGTALVLMEDPDPQILQLGTTYLRIISLSIFLRFLMIVINAILQGAGDMRTPLYLMVITNVFNITGNYFLIFGIGPFPQLGVTGAAIATAASGALGGALAIGVLFRPSCKVRLSLGDSFRVRLPVITDILRIGIPAAVEQSVLHGSQMLYTMLAAGLGAIPVAANQIMMSALSVTFLPCIGFSAVATTMVGQNLGAGNTGRARAGALETLRWALVFGLLVGVAFVFFPGLVVRGFTDDPQVIPLATRTLRLLGLAQPGLVTALVLAGGLRGAGDTKWVMYITALGMLGFRLAFSFSFLALGWGLVGLWAAAALDAYLRGFMVLARFNSGRWASVYVPHRASRSPAR